MLKMNIKVEAYAEKQHGVRQKVRTGSAKKHGRARAAATHANAHGPR